MKHISKLLLLPIAALLLCSCGQVEKKASVPAAETIIGEPFISAASIVEEKDSRMFITPMNILNRHYTEPAAGLKCE